MQAMHTSLIPSHKLASWILNHIRTASNTIGLQQNSTIEEIIYITIISIVAIALGVLIRKTALFITQKIIRLSHKELSYEHLFKKTLYKCSRIIPPLVFMALIPFAFATNTHTLNWILRIVAVYTLITLGNAINAILEFAWTRFDQRANTYRHPLKGVLNVCRGLAWIIIAIIATSVLFDKSPTTLLAGLGAFAAALMLVFKDSILGFVAGIQLSQNDMLRVGDWIIVPSTIANGIVKDVTLSVVKVQNWDNTMVMLPPYTLVSTSFQNWRNMFTIGARMINYNFFIDNSCIAFTTPQMIENILIKYPLAHQFINNLQTAKQTSNDNPTFIQAYQDSHSVNGTIDTNLGLFRAYAGSYLSAHPQIITDTQHLVLRITKNESFGTALNVICYSRQTFWAQFEALKAEVIEHLHAVAPDFGIKIFNTPNGNTFTISTENTSTPPFD